MFINKKMYPDIPDVKLSDLMYRFNVIADLDKLILEFTWKCKGQKQIFINNKVCWLALQNMRTHSKHIIIKNLWHWCRNKPGQKNRTERAEILFRSDIFQQQHTKLYTSRQSYWGSFRRKPGKSRDGTKEESVNCSPNLPCCLFL